MRLQKWRRGCTGKPRSIEDAISSGQRKGHQPRNGRNSALEAGTHKEEDSFLQPCQHVDLSPVELVLDFRPPEWEESESVL